MSPLYRNDLFFAHLSLYAFAAEYAPGGDVLDVGCGTGYGAAYVAESGARSVLGIDVDPQAVGFAAGYFQRPNLDFRTGDAGRLGDLGISGFDLVLALNSLEHVPDVAAFLHGVTDVLGPTGILIVAVPPVTSARQRLGELANPYHLNVWTPKQWLSAVGPYFQEVVLFGHFLVNASRAADFRNAPGQSPLTERDFVVRKVSDAAGLAGSLSVVIAASRPEPAERRPPAGAGVSFVDDSLTRKPPRWVPLEPDLLDVPPRPWRCLPARAVELVRVAGPGALAAEARRWLSWRIRRALSLRELRKR